jgi:hypothetical protein
MEIRNKRLTTKDMATIADRQTVIPVEGDSVGHEETLTASKVSPPSNEEELNPLLSAKEEKDLRARWSDIQANFVDEPRRAVENADELVAQTIHRLAQSFSDQKGSLEKQWEHSEQVSTEELRMALRRYRSFFDRLLSI